MIDLLGIGTLAYIESELFDANKPFKEKVDIYVFGIVIYFFLININIVLEDIDPQTVYKIAKGCDYDKLKHDYYLHALRLNHLKATYMLGLIYMQSEIVLKDIKKAIEYFEKAANGN
mgnify:CR=1 FL=1